MLNIRRRSGCVRREAKIPGKGGGGGGRAGGGGGGGAFCGGWRRKEGSVGGW